jgi:hypothetical protein
MSLFIESDNTGEGLSKFRLGPLLAQSSRDSQDGGRGRTDGPMATVIATPAAGEGFRARRTSRHIRVGERDSAVDQVVHLLRRQSLREDLASQSAFGVDDVLM